MVKRRRQVTAREPSGRPQREREYSPGEIRRLRDAAMSGLRDAEWGTELGRLYLEKHIDDGMYAAGRRWREQAHKYRSTLGVFPVRSAKLEVGSRGTEPDPDSEEGQQIARRERAAMEQFMGAHAELVAAGGTIALIVRMACEEDEPITTVLGRLALNHGLSLLARHYGLTDKAKQE